MLSETITNRTDPKEPMQVAEGIVMYPEIIDQEYLYEVIGNGYAINFKDHSFILHIAV